MNKFFSLLVTWTMLTDVCQSTEPFSDSQALSVVKAGDAVIGATKGATSEESKMLLSSVTIISMARAIVALGEYGSTKETLDYLERLSADELYSVARAPDWVMFSNENQECIKRVGRVSKIGHDTFIGESDDEAALGTMPGRTIKELARLAKVRVDERAKKTSIQNDRGTGKAGQSNTTAGQR